MPHSLLRPLCCPWYKCTILSQFFSSITNCFSLLWTMPQRTTFHWALSPPLGSTLCMAAGSRPQRRQQYSLELSWRGWGWEWGWVVVLCMELRLLPFVLVTILTAGWWPKTWQNKSSKERFAWAHSLRMWSFMTGKAENRQLVTPRPQSGDKEEEYCCLARILLVIHSRTHTMEWWCSHSRKLFPTQLDPSGNTPRDTPRRLCLWWF